MNLFFNKFLSNLPITPPSIPMRGTRYSTALQGPDKDTFTKADVLSGVSFTGKKGSTKKGEDLKKLNNITCPYSGVKMVSTKKMDEIAAELEKCRNTTERLEVLDNYQNCMQNLEREVFYMLKGYNINYPNKTINDCLNEIKPQCLAGLRIEESKVLDDIDKISYKLDDQTALKVRNVTLAARAKILSNNGNQIFKRKDLLTQLQDIKKTKENSEIFEEMWERALKLPRSATNFNAFVVKYANRSPQEITTRLLKPSTVTIEHIKPANRHTAEVESGDDDMTNFMLVSRDWNTVRGNTPLPIFIEEQRKKNKNIPRYSQMYINDIMNAIKKGKLKDYDWYPYVIKETLYKESDGLIDLNLDKYHIEKEDALKRAPKEVIAKYNKLLEENTAKRASHS